MAIRKIKLKRGLEADLPTLDIGEPGFTTDTKRFFIGSATGNIEYPSLTAVQALIDNLDLSEIDLEGYATEEYVDDAISEISIPSISGLATEDYVDQAVSGIETPIIIDSNNNAILITQDIDDIINQWEFSSDGATYLAKNFVSDVTYLSTPLNDNVVSLELIAGKDIYLRTSGYSNDGLGGSTSIAFKFDDEGNITLPLGGDILDSSGNSLLSESVDLTGYATENYVDSAISAINIPDLGSITFDNNDVTGNTIGQVGTIVSASTSSTGTTSSNSNALLLSSSIPNIDSVAIGWTVTFAGNITKTVVGITDISSEVKQIQFDGNAFVYNYPITMTSPDYVAGSDPEVNIIAGDKQWKFDNDGELTFPDGTVQTTAFNLIDAKDTYGCFHKLASLTAPAADTVYNFDWYTDTTVHESEGVTVTSSNPTRISIAKSGKYSVFTEMIVRINGSGERNVFLWLAKNGTDIPETGIKVSLRQGGVSNPVFETLAKQWFLDDINANDYIELRYALNRVDLIELEYTPAQTEPYIRPAIPSATITIIEV